MPAFKPKFEINGKILIFSDLHIGLKDSSTQYLNTCISVIKEIRNAVRKNKIENIIFCGDLFHSRKHIELKALNCGLTMISALAKYAKIYMICGNHDTYYKNSNEINSINIFKDNPNVVLIPQAVQVKINEKSALLVPWLGDLSKFKKESFDMMLGHFDISTNYLIDSYIEEHSTPTETSQELKNELGLEEVPYQDKIGEFVELVKKEGYIYCGHIHQRKEFIAKSRNIIFVGSPYQQNAGEIDSVDGYYILDENCVPKFHKIKNTPKHIFIKISEVLKKGVDNFDFSVVKNNIVRKIYDTQVTKEDETKINQKINLFNPFDELLPEHEVESKEGEDSIISCESLELIKKSKLDYLQTYINGLDNAVLDKMGLEKDKIYDIMKNYYERVGGRN